MWVLFFGLGCTVVYSSKEPESVSTFNAFINELCLWVSPSILLVVFNNLFMTYGVLIYNRTCMVNDQLANFLGLISCFLFLLDIQAT